MNARPMRTRYLRGVTLATCTNVKPVPNRRTPMIRKSPSFQSTSLVNCIAIKSIDNMKPVASAIQRKTLFCITISVFFVVIVSPPFCLPSRNRSQRLLFIKNYLLIRLNIHVFCCLIFLVFRKIERIYICSLSIFIS
jgi:hypothetical protein